MPVCDPTTRFSDRVDNYVRYRPDYPPAVLQVLRTECGLTPEATVADIGSGTGVLSRMLLENGNCVFAVEPNAAMRQAGERLLSRYHKLVSVAGTAENTTLADDSIDLVTAAQAAHWFDQERARREFVRILKPGGWCALIWNERRTDSTAFLQAYERLMLSYGTDYKDVRHEHTTANIDLFFAPSRFSAHVLEMRQEFDYQGLEGRLLSSSYAPGEGHPQCVPMLKELRQSFDQFHVDGKVAFEYNTRVYCGKLK
jgi:SAM-dependent methyltransferase